jgi:hypothetical protein
MAANVIHMMTLRIWFVNDSAALGSVLGGKIQSFKMTKETRLTLRVRSELKKSLEAIAAREARSVAQVCEVILQGGVAAYHKEGAKYLHRLFLSQKPKGDQG